VGDVLNTLTVIELDQPMCAFEDAHALLISKAKDSQSVGLTELTNLLTRSK